MKLPCCCMIQWSTRKFLSTHPNRDFSYFSIHCICIYNEILTRPNGIFTRLGWVDVDFFYLYDCDKKLLQKILKLKTTQESYKKKFCTNKELVSVFPWDYQLVAQWYYWFLLRVCRLLIYADDVAGFWIALCLRILDQTGTSIPHPRLTDQGASNGSLEFTSFLTISQHNNLFVTGMYKVRIHIW